MSELEDYNRQLDRALTTVRMTTKPLAVAKQRILLLLNEQGEQTDRDIADQTGLSTFALYKTLMELEHDHRWISSHWDKDIPGVIRRRLYKITDTGQLALEGK